MEPDLKANKVFVPIYKENMVLSDRQFQVLKVMQGGLQLRQEHKPIRVKPSQGDLYDLTEVFVEQLKWFPFGSKVDLLDAFSRIYDCDIREPSDLVQRYGRTYSQKRTPFSYRDKKKQVQLLRPSTFNKTD